MIPLITAESSRNCDRILIEEYGIPGYKLMCNAARGAFSVVKERITDGAAILIVCGKGNNGGDGFVLARFLRENGWEPEVYCTVDPEVIRGDARIAFEDCIRSGCTVFYEEPLFEHYGVIVDALFGTGLSRALEGPHAEILKKMNKAESLKIAMDIPSGVNASTGAILGTCFHADITVTFHYRKLGLVLTPGRAFAGEVITVPIAEHYPIKPDAYLTDLVDVDIMLPDRPMDSHKGKNGHALLVGGSQKYTGAVLLASRAAVRGGCGITTVAVPALVKPAFCVNPDVIAVSCGEGGTWDNDACKAAKACFDGKTAMAMGPGMDVVEDAGLIETALETNKPLVLDADALNTMALHQDILSKLHENVILTPHPGEMARLLGTDVKTVLMNPVLTARNAAKKYGCTVLLKGATTCISDGTEVYCNTTGNPGMAKGGSGDVLTGIILAMLSQGMKPVVAGYVGAYLFGATGDKAYRLLKNRLLTASDLAGLIMEDIHGERGY